MIHGWGPEDTDIWFILRSWLLTKTWMEAAIYQGISWPSQAKNLPLSLIFALSTMLRSFFTENSVVKSLPSGTFLWKGLERAVSTVPGCNKMQMIGSFFRASSTDIVLVTVNNIEKKRTPKLMSCIFLGWGLGFFYTFWVLLGSVKIEDHIVPFYSGDLCYIHLIHT